MRTYDREKGTSSFETVRDNKHGKRTCRTLRCKFSGKVAHSQFGLSRICLLEFGKHCSVSLVHANSSLVFQLTAIGSMETSFCVKDKTLNPQTDQVVNKQYEKRCT